MTETQNEHQREIDAINLKRAFYLTKKQVKDSKDFKQILILMGIPAIALLSYLTWVLICIP